MDRSIQKGSVQLKRHITNNHDYLNFVKKCNRQAEKEKHELIIPTPMEKAVKSSVFVLKDGKKEYKLQKATNLMSRPSYHLMTKNCVQNTQYINALRASEIIQRKNKEIQYQMIREKQNVSQIVYNYSKYRSMENQIGRLEKSQKRVNKRSSKIVKFPQLHKNNEIFTIDYDSEGKKIVKVELNKNEDNVLKSKDLDQKQLSRSIKYMFTEKQLSKRTQMHLFKRRRANHDFGIEIKVFNNKIIQEDAEYQTTGSKLRKELYQLGIEVDTNKQDRLNALKEEQDRELQKLKQTDISNKQQSTQHHSKSLQFKMVNSSDLLSSQVFIKYKSKSPSPLLEEHIKDSGHQVMSIFDHSRKKQLPQPQRQKIETVMKRQVNRKSMSIIYQRELTVYQQKINAYRQFLFIMNLVHRKYDTLALGDAGSLKGQERYKYFIGLGNNSLLVKSLMKRRFWWVQEDDSKKVNFAWTQLKINSFYQSQRKTDIYDTDSKHEVTEEGKKKKLAKKDSQIKSPLKSSIFFKAPLPQDKDKILTSYDKKIFQNLQANVFVSDMGERLVRYCNRLKNWEGNPFTLVREDKINQKMHNHFEGNHYIGNKKALYYNLKQYYKLKNKNVFQIIPLTFHIRSGAKDDEFLNFCKEFKKIETLKHQRKQKSKKQLQEKQIKNVWIIKPGQLSNRGKGIVVMDQLSTFVNILKRQEKHLNGHDKTYIVQKYIQNPLLYKDRKFDIRHYMIITRLHGIMRAYWYGQGYIRTSSYSFDLDDVGDQMIHLTNDAIQKNDTNYGKHEEGNKLSYTQFQKYLDQNHSEDKISFADQIYPKMKTIARDAIFATYLKMDPNALEHNFQIFGLDYMLDQSYNVWLIEVNTNPCLQLSSKLLSRIIPNMLEQAFRLSIDVIFPPPTHYANSQKYLAPDNPTGRLLYQLIFDEARDGKALVQLYKDTQNIDYGGEVKEDQDIYENEGKQIQLGAQIH